MTRITICTTLSDAPVNGLAQDPDINIWRTSDDVQVVTAANMTDLGSGGIYYYDFTPVPGEGYMVNIDADPTNSGQTDNKTYCFGFDNETNDIWNDRGLNPSVDKVITENTEGTDYTESVAAPTAITKSVVKSGTTTTIDRS